MIRLRDARLLGPQGLSAPLTVELPADVDEDRHAGGMVVSPGFCDLHAHLRDPGFTHKETLATGARSAAAGGFTSVVAMANTDPVTDSPELIARQLRRAAGLPVRLRFAAALTIGLAGARLTDAGALAAAGAAALSDDGRHAMDTGTLEEGLRRASAAGLPVMVHAQDERLGEGSEAEVSAVADAIVALRRVPDAALHLQHLSARAATELLADARSDGLRLTAEVTPHHLFLTKDELASQGPLARVNPPLRDAGDVAAVGRALNDGAIDIIATDHAPHEAASKRELASAAPGMHGFETALGVLLTLRIPWPVIYRALVAAPRRLLKEAVPADDWVVIDPDAGWTVDPAAFFSLGKNTPLAGRRLRGRVVMTICRGRLVHRAEVPVG